MRFNPMMIAATLILAASAASPASASDKTDVLAVVTHYNHAFNHGDVKGAVGDCAPQAIIIDAFAPHVWQGANACADWAAALAVYEKQEGISGDVLTLSKKPWQVSVTGDRGYVVVPTTYTYSQHGKKVVEANSVWTFALQKLNAGWRITAWSWAQH
jgi:hypothetical protein